MGNPNRMQIKRVVDIIDDHDYNVAKTMQDLNFDGYEIVKTVRIQRQFLIFGKNITDIYYIKHEEKEN